MNRYAGLVLVAGIAMAGTVVAVPAEAATGCAAIRADYPSGVALSVRRAENAYTDNWQLPEVKRKVYLKHQNLDPARTGVICRVRPRPTPPPKVKNLTVTPVKPSPDGTPTLLVTWEAGDRCGRSR